MKLRGNKLRRIGRRRFLNVAAGIGFSATALSYGNQEGLVSALGDPNNEVSYVRK
jgi:hypothetical protein